MDYQTQRRIPCMAHLHPLLIHHPIMLRRRSRATRPCVLMCHLSGHSLGTTQATRKDGRCAPIYRQITPTYHRLHPLNLHLQCHHYHMGLIPSDGAYSRGSTTAPWQNVLSDARGTSAMHGGVGFVL